MSDIGTRLLIGAVAATALGVMPVVQVSAQAIDRYQQGITHEHPRQISLSPRNDIDVSTDETEILPSLNGVVIINSPDDLRSGGASASGVETRGDVVPEKVVRAAEAYIGSPLSLASLDRMTRDMVLAFREAGIPVVNVVVPPQDISGSVVQIVAVVGRLGELAVEGNSSNPEYYREGFPLNQGDVIEENAVLDHLRWKSRRFHRRVNAIYAPGSGFSETDVTLDVVEDKPWTLFFGADNTGSGSVGDYRFFTGFTIGDLWDLDHELSYQFTTSEDGYDSLAAHVLSYILPVADRTDFQFTGAYVESAADTGPGTTAGESLQLGGTFITQLARMSMVSWDARYGFEYKRSDNTFEFGGIAAAGNETEVGQFFLQLTGQRGDSKSRTDIHAGVWLSPGDLFDRNSNAAFTLTRAGASADYAYARAGFDHTIFLPEDWFFNVEVDGQFASERLLPSEQIFLGGLNTIRGFEENSIRGDNGILARLELHAPSVSVLQNGPQDSLRLFGFFDAGAVTVNGTATAGEGDASIAGAGVGLTYQVENNFTAELVYGWQVDSDPLAGGGNGEFHFRVLTRF